MSNTAIAPGAIVQLNSGGPEMTVLSCFSKEDALWTYCSWFDGGAGQKTYFPAAALRLLRPFQNSEVTKERANGQDSGQTGEKTGISPDIIQSNTVDVPFHLPGFSETLYTLERQLEQILSSKLVGVCFLDDDRRLIQVIDEDPALREAIEEYYAERIRQMRLWAPTDETSQPAALH